MRLGEMSWIAVVLNAVVLASPVGAAEVPEEVSESWPQWRGPLGTGVAPGADPPVEWSEQRNVRWKLPLPGLGHSTPVVWKDRIFLTTAEAHGESAAPPLAHGRHADGAHDNLSPTRKHKFQVIAVDRRSGEILWRRTMADEQPHEGAHVTGSWASNSPVTDGEAVFAHFGSRGLFALTLDSETLDSETLDSETLGGEVRWRRDLGDMLTRHAHGEGSSPALHGDTLVVNWDHQGESFVVALDKRTGKERWRATRDEITSWSTPLIVEHEGRAQVIVSATKRTRAYDLATGKVIWECGGLSRNVVASPVAADGLVYVANSYDDRAMLAIRLSARGDVTGDLAGRTGDKKGGKSAIVWTRTRDTPYVPSPLLYDGVLYFLKHNQGFLTAVDAKTGEEILKTHRLPALRRIFASPVAAAGRVYVAGRDGATVVLKHVARNAGNRGSGSAALEVLAVNRLEDSFSASPVIVGEDLLLRGERNLYCLGQPSIQNPDRPVQSRGKGAPGEIGQ